MASTVYASLAASTTYYAVIRQTSNGQYYKGSNSFEAYNASDWTSYATAAASSNTSGGWSFAWPSTMSAGEYAYEIRLRSGGSAAVTDAVSVASTVVYWDTANVYARNNYATQAANVTTVAGQTVSATTSIAVGAAVGQAYAIQVDNSGYVKVSAGTNTGQLSLTSGVIAASVAGTVSANVTKIAGETVTLTSGAASGVTVGHYVGGDNALNVDSGGAALVQNGSINRIAASVLGFRNVHYCDPVNGNNSNDGLTSQTAFLEAGYTAGHAYSEQDAAFLLPGVHAVFGNIGCSGYLIGTDRDNTTIQVTGTPGTNSGYPDSPSGSNSGYFNSVQAVGLKNLTVSASAISAGSGVVAVGPYVGNTVMSLDRVTIDATDGTVDYAVNNAWNSVAALIVMRDVAVNLTTTINSVAGVYDEKGGGIVADGSRVFVNGVEINYNSAFSSTVASQVTNSYGWVTANNNPTDYVGSSFSTANNGFCLIGYLPVQTTTADATPNLSTGDETKLTAIDTTVGTINTTVNTIDGNTSAQGQANNLNSTAPNNGEPAAGSLFAIAGASNDIAHAGTATAGTATTLTLDSGAAAAPAYIGQTIIITGGTGLANDTRTVVSRVGLVVTVDRAWSVTPANGTTYKITTQVPGVIISD